MDIQRIFDVVGNFPATFKAIRERLEAAEARIEKLEPLADLVSKFDVGALTTELEAFARPAADRGTDGATPLPSSGA